MKRNFSDWSGQKIIWSKTKMQKHKPKHPETTFFLVNDSKDFSSLNSFVPVNTTMIETLHTQN
jgi:hypothetical protein